MSPLLWGLRLTSSGKTTGADYHCYTPPFLLVPHDASMSRLPGMTSQEATSTAAVGGNDWRCWQIWEQHGLWGLRQQLSTAKGTMDSMSYASGAYHKQVQARSTSLIAHGSGSFGWYNAFDPEWSKPTADERIYPRYDDTAEYSDFDHNDAFRGSECRVTKRSSCPQGPTPSGSHPLPGTAVKDRIPSFRTCHPVPDQSSQQYPQRAAVPKSQLESISWHC